MTKSFRPMKGLDKTYHNIKNIYRFMVLFPHTNFPLKKDEIRYIQWKKIHF